MGNIFSRSLSAKFLAALLLGGIVAAATGSWLTYRVTAVHMREQVLERAKLLASALNHSAMVAASAVEVRHVVEEVLKDSPEVELILIVTRDPMEIMAATEPSWNGAPLDRLPDLHLREDIEAALEDGGFGFHFDEGKQELMLIAPLQPHMSAHAQDGGHMMAGGMSGGQSAGQGGMQGHDQMMSGNEPAMRAPDQMKGMTAATGPAPGAASPAYRGAIVMRLDETRAEQAISSITGRLNLVIIVATALVMVLAYLLLRRQVLAPVGALRAAMKRQESGDRGARVPVSGSDELGTVARTFNRMLDTIAEGENRNALLATVLDQASDAIEISDTQLRIEYVNPAFEKITGYTASEAIGNTVADMHRPGSHDPTFYQEIADTLAAGRAWRGNLVARRKNGALWDVEATISPVLDETGTVTHHLAIKRDITERKRAEAQLLAAKEEAVLGNRAKSEFLANMSHELRTPLNAIIGFSEIMTGQLLGPVGVPKYLEYAVDIHDSGLHLLELINDILDLSKIEAGKLELAEEEVDVMRALESCLTIVKERVAAAGLALGTEIDERLPVLWADERRFKQVVLNLLSNAIKFTPAGGTVTLKASGAPERGFTIGVIDTGIGIRAEDIAVAMSPFGQVDSDLNRKYQGTGLGLPLIKAIVEMHGGTLALESEFGVGTMVTAWFPAERVKARAA